MADPNRIDAPTGTGFVGHEWDGIEELDTPMPRWWVWTFVATIIWSLGFIVLYPALPLVNGATTGVLGWSSRGELANDMAREAARRAPITAAIAAQPIAAVAANPRLRTAAIAGGASAYQVHCIQCHGTGAAGVAGVYPSLIDDDWLWGGDLASIEFTLQHGIRNPDHGETRFSIMPNFGRDGILTKAEIQDVVSHVRTISGQEPASAAAARGAGLFANNCAACHGAAGQGLREFGAPNLTDRIWMYGGSRAELTAMLNVARAGVMPRFGGRLDDATIKKLAIYIHSKGGGEAAPVAPPPVEQASAQ